MSLLAEKIHPGEKEIWELLEFGTKLTGADSLQRLLESRTFPFEFSAAQAAADAGVALSAASH